MLFLKHRKCDLCASLNSYAESEVNCTLQIRKCKGHQKRDRLLVSKVKFHFQIFQLNINLFDFIQYSQTELILFKKCTNIFVLKFRVRFALNLACFFFALLLNLNKCQDCSYLA